VSDASIASAPQRPEDAVEVGRVAGAWGVQGAIKVSPFAADPQALFSSKRWYVVAAATGARPGAPLPPLLHIVQARQQGEHVVATARELADRDAAEALKGARILISRASFPTPEEGEFYWIDLIGCRVFNREGSDLGVVDHLLPTGPHCVLVIAAADGAEIMVPFVEAYVDRVDAAARRIEVDWDPGWGAEDA